MTDAETRRIVAAFESCELPELDHADHIRIAWYYLRQASLPTVLAELPPKLRNYARSKGAPEKYHETITFAFVCLIHERMARSEARSWAAFAKRNGELFDPALLERYYPNDLLHSEQARRFFHWPAPHSGRAAARIVSSRTRK